MGWFGPNKQEQLFDAIRTKNAASVKDLLSARVNLTARSTTNYLSGHTHLHAAAYCCLTNTDVSILNMLCRAGASPNAEAEGETPLHVAAKSSGPEAVQALLGAGAEIDARTTRGNTGRTPLHYAVDVCSGYSCDGRTRTESAQFGTILVLVTSGANVCARNDHGSTPLDRALTKLYEALGQNEAHYLDIVEALVAHGADVHVMQRGPSATEGSRRMVEALLDRRISRRSDARWEKVERLLAGG